MFPDVNFPSEYSTTILKAAYLFAHLTFVTHRPSNEDKGLISRCYLITHAHLDHALSLILLSGSLPPRPSRTSPGQATSEPSRDSETKTSTTSSEKGKAGNGTNDSVPVFGTRETLEKLAMAYGGGLWPELGHWHAGEQSVPRASTRGKKRKVDVVEEIEVPPKEKIGVVLTP
jgi:hypothetical protein